MLSVSQIWNLNGKFPMDINPVEWLDLQLYWKEKKVNDKKIKQLIFLHFKFYDIFEFTSYMIKR